MEEEKVILLEEEVKPKKKRTRGNGEGTICKRQDDSWCAAITVGTNPDTGKPIRKYFYGKTRPEVAKKLTKALNDLENGVLNIGKDLTFGQWLDVWFKDYAKPNVRAITWSKYEMLIKLHIKPDLEKIQLSKLKPNNIQQLYNNKLKKGRVDKKGGLSRRPVELIHTIIHSSLKQAIKENLIIRNVSDSTKLPSKVKKEVKILSQEDQDKFIEELLKERLGMAFLLDIFTGLRRGELLGLKWEDVDFNEKQITIKRSLQRVKKDGGGTELKFEELKTDKSYRTIPIPQVIFDELIKYQEKQEVEKQIAKKVYTNKYNLIFCTSVGTPIEPRNFNRLFDKILKNAKIDHINLHALRHTYATRLFEMNEHPKTVQELLGHAKVGTTIDTYTHVAMEQKQLTINRLNLSILERKNPPNQLEDQVRN